MAAGGVGAIWEQLARLSTAMIPIDGVLWKPANRFWGNASDGNQVEIDVIAESFDGTRILIGEAKWQIKVDVEAEFKRLERLAPLISIIQGRKISFACWVPDADKCNKARYNVIGAQAVMTALR
jgi:hypothetical protein